MLYILSLQQIYPKQKTERHQLSRTQRAENRDLFFDDTEDETQ